MNNNDGCYITLVILALIVALLFNPFGLEFAQEKFQNMPELRQTISNTEVNLYREGYFIFSQYYIQVGSDAKPVFCAWGTYWMVFLENEPIIDGIPDDFDGRRKLE